MKIRKEGNQEQKMKKLSTCFLSAHLTFLERGRLASLHTCLHSPNDTSSWKITLVVTLDP